MLTTLRRRIAYLILDREAKIIVSESLLCLDMDEMMSRNKGTVIGRQVERKANRVLRDMEGIYPCEK